MKKIILFIILILSFACTNRSKNLNSHEKLYYSVADSLLKYKSAIQKASDGKDEVINDFITLDFDSFKSKHKLSNQEMDQVSNVFKVRYELGRAYQAIDENMNKIDDTKSSIDKWSKSKTKDEMDYKFDPNKPEGKGNSYEVNVLKKSSDTEIKAN
ncbi:MAG: hypothetical protein WC044_08365 [Crocinitomicaceae bacterium]